MKTPLLFAVCLASISLSPLSSVFGQALPFDMNPAPPPPPAGTATARPPDGIAMKDGVVYIIQNGVASRVTEERVMRVAPNGMVTGFDGRTWIVPSGQIITTDGRAVPVGQNMFNTPEEARAASSPVVSGDNRSGLAPAPSSTTASSSAMPSGSSSPTPASSPASGPTSQAPTTVGGSSSPARGGSTNSGLYDLGIPFTLNADSGAATVNSQDPANPAGANVDTSTSGQILGSGTNTQTGVLSIPGDSATASGNNPSGTSSSDTTEASGTTGANGTSPTGQATPNRQRSSGAPGAGSQATPNQQRSSGAPDAGSQATPNQQSSAGTPEAPTGASATSPAGSGSAPTNNPNAVRTTQNPANASPGGTGASTPGTNTGTGNTPNASGTPSSGSTNRSATGSGSSSSGRFSSGGSSSGGGGGAGGAGAGSR